MADMRPFENLVSLIRTQKGLIDTLNLKLKQVKIEENPEFIEGTNISLSTDQSLNTVTINSTIGRTIAPGTTFSPSATPGSTFTAGANAEIYNNYQTSGTELKNEAAGNYSHAEGSSNGAYADYSHVEGKGNVVASTGGHAEGLSNLITDACTYCHVEGVSNKIYQGGLTGVHVEGADNVAQTSSRYAHVEGQNNIAIGPYDHVEGYGNKTSGSPLGHCHLEGYSNEIISSMLSHIEGETNKIIGNSYRSHVEGNVNIIQATWSGGQSWESHIEGRNNLIESASRAHAEGYNNKIYKAESGHVEGNGCIVGDATNQSIAAEAGHAEGYNCKAKNAYAHAQNNSTTASGTASTSMGAYTTASGVNSLSVGYNTTASGTNSISAGNNTTASGNNQFAFGEYNVSSSTTVSKTDPNSGYNYSLTKFPFIIGNGYHDSLASADKYSDALKIDCDGKIYVGSDATGVDVKALNDEVVTARSTYQNLNARLDDMPTGCTITTDTTTTTLPAKVVLANNSEYRYLSLTAATGISISIEDATAASGSFYSTLVLHNISSTDPISTFVTVDSDSLIDNIIFLNEDSVDLSQADTMEMMFFTNGMSNVVMCIAYAYTQPVLP